VLSININNNVINLSVTLQLPFDDCPTVAAAHTVDVCCSDSGTVVVCVCVCAITVILLTIMLRASYVSYSFP